MIKNMEFWKNEFGDELDLYERYQPWWEVDNSEHF